MLKKILKKIILKYLRSFPLDHGKVALSSFLNLNIYPNSVLYKNSMGLTFELDLSEYQMKQIFLYDQYEKNTIRHLLKLLKPKMVAIDVGANIGFYSLVFASCLKNGEVFSFEPNNHTLEKIKKNIYLNQVKNINLFSLALSNKSESSELHYDLNNLGSASVYKKKSQYSQNIEFTTLDDFCDENRVSNVDVIKVDIEGGEMKFLEGAQETIIKNKRLILIVEMVDENCKMAGYSADELFSKIIKMGFKSFIPKGWPFPMKAIEALPLNYHDNVIFLKGYN